MSTPRIYSGKDSEMLIAIAAITQAAIANQATLIASRATWADPFFPDFETRINTAISTYLGVDSALALRTQTATLTQLITPAKTNLADVKIQIGQDFKTNKPRLNELLTTLGYNNYWTAASNSDQEALIQLLFQFKTNLTPTIRTELETKGINGLTLTAITNAADALLAANISQETLKQSRKALTEAATNEFNTLYSQAIAIATISRRIFKNSPAIQDQFSYTKILKNLRSGTLSTLFEDTILVSDNQSYIIPAIRITAKTIITAFTTSNHVYACRNETGCISSGLDTYHLTPEVPNTIRKTDLLGDGNLLVFTSLSPGLASINLKIQG